MVIRLDGVGVADATFGTSGVQMISTGKNSSVSAVRVLGDGSILGAGVVAATFGTESPLLGARMTSTGAADPTLGAWFSRHLGTSSSSAVGVTQQPDGRIVLMGTGSTDTVSMPRAFALVRFGTDGTWDLGFGGARRGVVHVVLHTSTFASELAHGAAFDASGRLLVAGATSTIRRRARRDERLRRRARAVAAQAGGGIVLVGRPAGHAAVARVRP